MTTAIKGNDTSTFGGAIAANNVSAIVPAFSAYQYSSSSLKSFISYMQQKLYLIQKNLIQHLIMIMLLIIDLPQQLLDIINLILLH
jgi:hypothetical protein